MLKTPVYSPYPFFLGHYALGSLGALAYFKGIDGIDSATEISS